MNIGVFFGGKSPEHDVSIITGQLIISELKKMQHNVVPIYLGKNGEWYVSQELGTLKFFQDSQKDKKLLEFSKVSLDLEKSQGKMVFQKKGFMGQAIEIDLAFPAFHGSNGEDGTIQGMFELCNLPYVGCDVASSAIAYDKILTKTYYKSTGTATANFMFFSKKDWDKNRTEIIANIKNALRYPLFVKPPKLGSSIGISKAKDDKELEFAIEVALHYGEKVLVEEGVENLMDITCCVIGNDELKASLIQESVFESELFDFKEKYLVDGGAQLGNATDSLVIPARLDEDTTKNVQELAKEIYLGVGASGIARVDFLYDTASKKVYANEINPMPGTVYHHLWKASGLELDALLKKLIDFAVERHREKNKFKYTFDSDMMSFANSVKLKLKKN
ncbi:MAG: D-alanine--D-alanine ligase family protein [Candidatus Moraniibacteriota bacterium]|jgi:D-alanine-D-alanine ligase